MSINVIDYYAYQLEWQVNRLTKPPMIFSALETIDAAMWLIAGFRYAQALTSLSTSIELLLKGELLKYDIVLIDESVKLTVPEVHAYLQSKKEANQPSFNLPDHTIGAKEAIKRVGYVGEHEKLFQYWSNRLLSLFNIRNDIVHSGSNAGDEGLYADSIVSIAIPFIDTFLISANNISLKTLLTPGIYLELEVAKRVCERLKREKLPSKSYVLLTTAFKVIETFAPKPASDNDVGHQHRLEEEISLSHEVEREINIDWADGDWVTEFCKICDSVQTFVKVKPYIKPKLGLLPVSIRCPKCGLRIEEKDKYLAMYHMQLRDETISDFFKNDFYEEDYDNLELDKLL